MKCKVSGLLAVSFALLAVAVPALAHHSFTAEFDSAKMISVTGVLNRVDWVNPHTYYYVDGKDESGNPVSWEIESMPPGMLHKAGVNKDMFKLGEVVTIDGWAAKDGSKHLAFAKTFHFADGHTIKTMNDDIQVPPDGK
jgi:hypothetical protein